MGRGFLAYHVSPSPHVLQMQIAQQNTTLTWEYGARVVQALVLTVNCQLDCQQSLTWLERLFFGRFKMGQRKSVLKR